MKKNTSGNIGGGAVKEVKSLVLPFYCRKKKSTPVLPSVVLPF